MISIKVCLQAICLSNDASIHSASLNTNSWIDLVLKGAFAVFYFCLDNWAIRKSFILISKHELLILMSLIQYMFFKTSFILKLAK